MVKGQACGQDLQANQMESSIEASPSNCVARVHHMWVAVGEFVVGSL